MAENINIGTFELDTARLESSLDRLQNRMFELKKEQELYNTVSKESQKVINDLVKEQLRLADAGEENTEAFEDNAKAIEDLNKAQLQNYKNSQNVATNMSRVRQEITATNTQLKAYTDSEAKFTTLTNSANVALSKQINNINDARASNTEILRVRNQLNPAIEEEARLITELNDKLNQNNDYIKQNASAYEQQKINIGNYKEDIKGAFSELNIFNGGLSGFASRASEAGGAGALLGTSLKTVTTATVGLTKATLAFLLTPIGAVLAAVVAVFLLVKNAMDKNKASADKITSVFNGLSSVFNAVLKILEPLGTYIIDVLVGAFELLANGVEVAAQAFADAQDFFGFGDAAEDTRELIAETKASTQAAYELAKAERELEIAQNKSRLTQLQYQKTAEQLRQLRDDESKSTADRIDSNRLLGNLLDEQARKELAIANQAVRVAELRAKASKLDVTIQADYIEALTQVADIEERIEGQRSEKLANDNSLRKEAADKEKARQDEAIAKAKERSDKAIKAMQTELAFYIASMGDEKRAMEQQLAFDEEVRKRSIAIAKAEYDAKKTTLREYQLAVLEANNEFAKNQLDQTIENANIELELFKINNQRKLDENKFFSEELYNQEVERLNRIAEAEKASIDQRYILGLISREEYNLALRQIDDENRKSLDEAEAERKQAKKDKEAADLANEALLNQDRADYDLAYAMAQYEKEYQARKEIAIKNGADMVLFEQAEAEIRKKIEQNVQNNKLALASNTFGQLASILGKESAAGKAAAVAQATIDTYKSATSAYSSLAGIPVVGPALGAVAAGAAVVAGLANVKKIVSTKSAKVEGGAPSNPGYASGVIGLPGIGSGTSDSITANLSAGESVITARATQMFPELLGAINQIGGGVGVNGSTSSIIQDQIGSNASSQQTAQIMADAVYQATLLGTAQGASKGIVDLTDNRQVMENAKF